MKRGGGGKHIRTFLRPLETDINVEDPKLQKKVKNFAILFEVWTN